MKSETFGLQINDKIYFIDGKYKYSTSKGVKILEEYPAYPEWATEELIVKYDTFKNNLFNFWIYLEATKRCN